MISIWYKHVQSITSISIALRLPTHTYHWYHYDINTTSIWYPYDINMCIQSLSSQSPCARLLIHIIDISMIWIGYITIISIWYKYIHHWLRWEWLNVLICQYDIHTYIQALIEMRVIEFTYLYHIDVMLISNWFILLISYWYQWYVWVGGAGWLRWESDWMYVFMSY